MKINLYLLISDSPITIISRELRLFQDNYNYFMQTASLSCLLQIFQVNFTILTQLQLFQADFTSLKLIASIPSKQCLFWACCNSFNWTTPLSSLLQFFQLNCTYFEHNVFISSNLLQPIADILFYFFIPFHCWFLPSLTAQQLISALSPYHK